MSADGLRADRFFELNDSFADIGRERISGYLGLEPNMRWVYLHSLMRTSTHIRTFAALRNLQLARRGHPSFDMSWSKRGVGVSPTPGYRPNLDQVLMAQLKWAQPPGVVTNDHLRAQDMWRYLQACMKTLAQLQRDGQRILCNTTPVERPQSLIELWPMELIPLATVFNQSVHSWLFGSPDIVPMFAQYPHVEEYHYQPEEEDFAAADGDNFVSFNCGMEELMTDNDAASLLDIWVFRKVVSMFRDAELNATLDEVGRE